MEQYGERAFGRLGCAPCEGDLVIDDAEDMILEEEAALEAGTVVAVETGCR